MRFLGKGNRMQWYLPRIKRSTRRSTIPDPMVWDFLFKPNSKSDAHALINEYKFRSNSDNRSHGTCLNSKPGPYPAKHLVISLQYHTRWNLQLWFPECDVGYARKYIPAAHQICTDKAKQQITKSYDVVAMRQQAAQSHYHRLEYINGWSRSRLPMICRQSDWNVASFHHWSSPCIEISFKAKKNLDGVNSLRMLWFGSSSWQNYVWLMDVQAIFWNWILPRLKMTTGMENPT